jgi:hypothetical protein
MRASQASFRWYRMCSRAGMNSRRTEQRPHKVGIGTLTTPRRRSFQTKLSQHIAIPSAGRTRGIPNAGRMSVSNLRSAPMNACRMASGSTAWTASTGSSSVIGKFGWRDSVQSQSSPS